MTPERDQDYLQLQRELAALQVENERLKADQERLSWLEARTMSSDRDASVSVLVDDDSWCDLRRAIDNAMNQTTKLW